jgi:hypothetical protein
MAKKAPKTADELFSLRGVSYDRAIANLLENAIDRGACGWNPIGGESDDIDVIHGFREGTHEEKSSGNKRIFRRDENVFVSFRMSCYPIAYRVLG